MRAAPASGQAIAVMCFGVFCLVLNDALGKWLVASYPPVQMIFVRNLLALPMIAAVIVLRRAPGGFTTRHVRVHALRGLLMVAAAYCLFSGLRVLPLAEVTALGFTTPIFITALSVPLLREPVGWRRWAAVLVGFVGVLIVLRPGAATFQPASLFIIATAFLYALFLIAARWIGRQESFFTMMFFVMLFPVIYAGPLAALDWHAIAPDHFALFMGMAACGPLGITLIGHAFRLAPAAAVAPFDYTSLVWASLFGWLMWGELPDAWTYAGAAVIIAGGVYILLRETKRARV